MKKKKDDIPSDECTETRGILQWCDALTIEKLDVDADQLGGYNQFAINQRLSMVDMFLPACDIAVRLMNLSELDNYRFWVNTLPKRKFNIRWVLKKPLKKVMMQNKFLMDWYEFGMNDCRQIRNVLTEKQIDDICLEYPEYRKEYGKK